MSKMAEALNKVQSPSSKHPNKAELLHLPTDYTVSFQQGSDPFKKHAAPSFFRRLFLGLTFDRFIVLVLTVVAILVLTYRASVHRQSEALLRETINSEDPVTTVPSDILVTHQTGGIPESVPAGPVVKAPAVSEAAAAKPVKEAQKPKEKEQPYYTLQLASFHTKKAARRETVKWSQSSGFEAFVIEKGKFYLLVLGRFKEKSEASQALKKLKKDLFKKKFADASIRRVVPE